MKTSNYIDVSEWLLYAVRSIAWLLLRGRLPPA